MNGITSQLLSLITHGNQFITTGQIPLDYYPDNIAFKFCNTVNFIHLAGQADAGTQETVVAANPPGWFALLKQEGCRMLKAYFHPSAGNETGTPDHKLAGFVGGGGTWLIEDVYASCSNFWAARWEVTQPDEPNRNIWAVSYGRTITHTETINFCPDTQQARQRLQEVLIEITAFARQHELANWADIFQNALDILKTSAPANSWHTRQIDETGYSQTNLQLMYAAMAAHVFGGMGSWNDLGFEKSQDMQQYDDLSYRLYDCINRALISSINSFTN